MSDIILLFKNDLIKLINLLEKDKIIINFKKNNINIDYSSKSKQGHLSTNIFLLLLKEKINKDFNLKDYIVNYLNNIEYIDNVDIPKAGFINIYIKKDFLILSLENLITQKDNFETIKKQNINIEFVSANPTGPIHVAHLRGAVLGDVLASILELVGHKVTREYYVNDAGSQIKILGASLFKRYEQLFDIDSKLLEGEYPGSYLIEIAKKIKISDGNKWIVSKDVKKKEEHFKFFAVNFLIDKIKEDLSLINVSFDKFTFESQIVKDRFLEKVFQFLEDKNLIYEGYLPKPLGLENKNWEPRKQLLFRSTNFSDDFDRAFKKENGEWTYFANDSAYHYEKFTRGYDKLINVLGADHIGYINRIKSIADVTSGKKNYLDVIVCQIVRLIRNNKLLKMSKRDDNFISLKDIYNEVGKDALRYYMISTKNETPMDFDMDKVIEKNKDNPVFYCQYAYARASSVIRKSKEYKIDFNINKCFHLFENNSLSVYEWEIILRILSWPHVIKLAADYKQPHRIINYLEDLCSLFHSFWNKGKDNASLRFIDEDNIKKTITKLIWIQSLRNILKEIFDIIGIEAPEIM